MTPSYTCFFHPRAGFDRAGLDDVCPECGRPYRWPLDNAPDSIGPYKVLGPKARGFYGTTYIVTKPPLSQKRLLKIVPKKTYIVMGKSWETECEEHALLATPNQPHFARLIDCGEASVDFRGDVIECYWAELDYYDGPTLKELLEKGEADVLAVAQIALDLLEMLRVLEMKERHHNDLHAGNIIVAQLAESELRRTPPDIERSLRAVAIDFGSLAPAPKAGRPSDRERIGEMLIAVAEKLLRSNPDQSDSRIYRLAAVLTQLRDIFSPAPGTTVQPTYEEISALVKRAVSFVDEVDWDEDDPIASFTEGYNAQTLRPSTVARLLVDDEKWTTDIATGGAQVVLGMRGCGKTMLLRSLDFHARVASARNAQIDPMGKIRDDHFVGLFVSGQRLLDARRGDDVDFRPLLFVAYAREAARVIRHLEQIGTSDLDPQATSYVMDVLRTHVGGLPDEVVLSPVSSELDHSLSRLLSQVAAAKVVLTLGASSATAFQDLARALARASSVWGNVRILFLLDDISTRYLTSVLIAQVLAEVLFQSDVCAFKITTEAQTWITILRSPGNVEILREERDFKRFDLGERVGRRLAKDGWRFIDALLTRRLEEIDRAKVFGGRPAAEILGRHSLQHIAEQIVDSEATSVQRKQIYFGIDALSSICVGNIGDTIGLFDRMMEAVAGAPAVPIPSTAQHKAFMDYCVQRLFELNTRMVDLKDFAMGFADAAHELLRRSGAKKSGASERLRQYTKVYVRLGDRDSGELFQRVRELIDAGVFVFDGGSPRSKTRDFDPLQHFILAYRKLLGLSSFIPLSDRDRFELSGTALKEWLESPRGSADILIRNQDNSEGVEDDDDIESNDEVGSMRPGRNGGQTIASQGLLLLPGTSSVRFRAAPPDLPKVTVETLSLGDLANAKSLFVFTALGFEQRALESTNRLLAIACVRSAIAVDYPRPLRSDAVEAALKAAGAHLRLIRSPDEIVFDDDSSDLLIDVTGMKTTFVFEGVRRALRSRRKIWVLYTGAKQYAPTDEEIGAVLSGRDEDNLSSADLEQLRALASGESHEYEFVRLMPPRDDITRPLALLAVASPKIMRLEKLVAERSFDQLYLLTSSRKTLRGQLSRLAASAVAISVGNGRVHEVSSTGLQENVELLERLYRDAFVQGGMDVAFGLTGSKVQGVAMAALSERVKVAEAWYVTPSSYDADTFTGGTGESKVFRIALE